MKVHHLEGISDNARAHSGSGRRFSSLLPARNKKNTPKRIRTAAAGVKGRCPRPLDDGGVPVKYSRESLPQAIYPPEAIMLLVVVFLPHF
jgi:hypothetical protein